MADNQKKTPRSHHHHYTPQRVDMGIMVPVVLCHCCRAGSSHSTSRAQYRSPPNRPRIEVHCPGGSQLHQHSEPLLERQKSDSNLPRWGQDPELADSNHTCYWKDHFICQAVPGGHLATSFPEVSQVGIARSHDGCVLIVKLPEYAVILPIGDLRNIEAWVLLNEVCDPRAAGRKWLSSAIFR